MPRINLLPWREQQRTERKKAFGVGMFGAFVESHRLSCRLLGGGLWAGLIRIQREAAALTIAAGHAFQPVILDAAKKKRVHGINMLLLRQGWGRCSFLPPGRLNNDRCAQRTEMRKTSRKARAGFAFNLTVSWGIVARTIQAGLAFQRLTS